MSYIDMADTGQIITIETEAREVGEATQVLTPPPPRRLDGTYRRRPAATGEQPTYQPRTIGVVDSPADTGQLPAYIQAAMNTTRPAPMPRSWPTPPPVPSASERRRYIGRHRANRSRRGIGGDK